MYKRNQFLQTADRGHLGACFKAGNAATQNVPGLPMLGYRGMYLGFTQEVQFGAGK